jgi:hypothetical protein
VIHRDVANLDVEMTQMPDVEEPYVVEYLMEVRSEAYQVEESVAVERVD